MWRSGGRGGEDCYTTLLGAAHIVYHRPPMRGGPREGCHQLNGTGSYSDTNVGGKMTLDKSRFKLQVRYDHSDKPELRVTVSPPVLYWSVAHLHPYPIVLTLSDLATGLPPLVASRVGFQLKMKWRMCLERPSDGGAV